MRAVDLLTSWLTSFQEAGPSYEPHCTSPCSWSPVTVWEFLSSSGPQEQPSLWFITKSKAAIFLFFQDQTILCKGKATIPSGFCILKLPGYTQAIARIKLVQGREQ